jgi:hypothetical protein
MNRFPSHRPKVSEVKNWCVVFSHKVDRTWKVNQPQSVTIQRADPFWDFYRVCYVNHTTGDKTSKLFYGESSHFEVQRYVNDLGFVSAYAMNL